MKNYPSENYDLIKRELILLILLERVGESTIEPFPSPPDFLDCSVHFLFYSESGTVKTNFV